MNCVERIKAICKGRKIPISKLERDLGFANGYIGQLRKGVLPSDRLVQVAEYLSVTPTYLMTGENNKTAPTPKDERLIDDKNVLRIAGRDGSYVVKVLTDEQMKAFMTMVAHLPDAYENL